MKKIIIPLCILALTLACQMATPTPQVENIAQVSPSPTEKPPEATRKPPEKHKQNTCTVYAENLHLRASPDASAPVVAYLKAGDQLTPTPTKSKGIWIQVSTQEGLTGWVNSKFINCERK